MAFKQNEGKVVDGVCNRRSHRTCKTTSCSIWPMPSRLQRLYGCCKYLEKHCKSTRGRFFWYAFANYQTDCSKFFHLFSFLSFLFLNANHGSSHLGYMETHFKTDFIDADTDPDTCKWKSRLTRSIFGVRIGGVKGILYEVRYTGIKRHICGVKYSSVKKCFCRVQARADKGVSVE